MTSDDEHETGVVIVRELDRLIERNKRFNVIMTAISLFIVAAVLWLIFSLVS